MPGIAMGPGHAIRLLLVQVAAEAWGSQVAPNNSVLLKLFPLFKALHQSFYPIEQEFGLTTDVTNTLTCHLSLFSLYVNWFWELQAGLELLSNPERHLLV